MSVCNLTSIPPLSRKSFSQKPSDLSENSETVSDIGENIGFYMTVCENLEFVEEYINVIEQITLDDIKEVAQKYLDINHATISVLMPESYKN